MGRRIAYSPEVRVYIQPNETDDEGKLVPPIDISNDIIEGSIERRSNDVSTARFVLQGRRSGGSEDNTTSILLSGKIRPMDRIVVYLKKTKPILVFSGYIDLVPLVQFVPEPVVIEASCSLKRLQYTYFDPTLPNVMQAFLQMGMIVQNNDSGFNVFQPPGADSTGTGDIEDQGFPKLLSFLLIDVGGWNPDTVYIEPLPQEWLDTVEPMFRNFIVEDQTWESAKEFLDAWLGAEPSGDGGGGVGGSGTHVLVDEEKVLNYLKSVDVAQWIIDQLPTYYNVGTKHKVDPRFLIAITLLETSYGKHQPAVNRHNPGGLGTDYSYPSWEVSIPKMATITWESKSEYDGKYTVEEIGSVWAPVSDPRNDNANWPKNVKSFMEKMGANPNFPVRGPKYEKAVEDAASPTRNSAAGTGTRDNNTLTVYLEAVGAGANNDTFLNGYQKLDFFARGYEVESSINRMAKNRDIAKRIKDRVNEIIATQNRINKSKKIKEVDPIDIKIVYHSDVTKGWKGDLYLAIDHTDSDRDEDFCYYVTPKGSSPNLTNPSITQGYRGPLNTGQYGSDWKKPSSIFGRDVIKNDKSLIKNSNNFINLLGKAKNNPNSKKSGNGLTAIRGSQSFSSEEAAKNSWNGSIPGFFYTAASTCAYLQLPNKSSEWIPETDDWAWQIAIAIYDYAIKMKSKGKIQKTIAEGNPNKEDTTDRGNGTSVVGSEKFFNPLGGVKWNNLGGVAGHKARPENNWQSDYAVDMGVPEGTPVFAPFSGKIVKEGLLDSSDPKMAGIRVGLEGNTGYSAYLAHLSSTIVKVGDEVTGGQQIGLSGKAGPPHLHFGMAKGSYNAPYSAGIDPMPFLDGASTDVSGGSSSGNDDSKNYQDAINFNRAAFNVAYQFPGSLVDSLLLRGKRALQNDVPLFDSVKDIAIGSMRNFASLPNGDFIAWYPDYFNIAKRTPWLRISQLEIKKCTIDFSDKYLTTHVYIMGNPYGIGNFPSANSDWYEKLQGAGVITIEQEGILDSFLYPLNKEEKTKDKTKKDKEERTDDGEDFEFNQKESSLNFLEKYGARPYTESNLTIRHPIVEFFYAYHTFMTKWAEQFISRAEFTFMPELFPGMIIEIPNYQNNIKSFTFYVQDVTHTFSYSSGFSTSAVLIAPGMTDYDETKDPIGMVAVRPPSGARPATVVPMNKSTTGKKQTYKEWLNGRKSTKKLAAQWDKLDGIS